MTLSVLYISIALIALLLFYLGTGKSAKALFICFTWMTIVGALAVTGFFEDTISSPPRFLLVLLGNVSLVIYLLTTIKVTEVNAHALLLVHVLRLPVELGFHFLFLQQLIPEIMTYQGWNFDIILGVSALALYIYAYLNSSALSSRLFYYWNIYGLVSLLIIVVIAILSAPLPFQQLAFDQPNVAVLKFPFIFVPSFVVPLVLLSHLLVLKALRTERDIEHKL